MLKRLLSVVLTSALLTLIPHSAVYSQTQNDDDLVQAAKVRKRIIKHGIGKKARIEVKLKDKRRIKGYTGGIAEDHFVLVNGKNSEVVTVPYSQVEELKTKRPSALIPLAILGGTLGGIMLLVALSLRGS